MVRLRQKKTIVVVVVDDSLSSMMGFTVVSTSPPDGQPDVNSLFTTVSTKATAESRSESAPQFKIAARLKAVPEAEPPAPAASKPEVAKPMQQVAGKGKADPRHKKGLSAASRSLLLNGVDADADDDRGAALTPSARLRSNVTEFTTVTPPKVQAPAITPTEEGRSEARVPSSGSHRGESRATRKSPTGSPAVGKSPAQCNVAAPLGAAVPSSNCDRDDSRATRKSPTLAAAMKALSDGALERTESGPAPINKKTPSFGTIKDSSRSSGDDEAAGSRQRLCGTTETAKAVTEGGDQKMQCVDEPSAAAAGEVVCNARPVLEYDPLKVQQCVNELPADSAMLVVSDESAMLLQAARRKPPDKAVLNALLESKAHANAVDGEGSSVLLLASLSPGHPPILQLLVHHFEQGFSLVYSDQTLCCADRSRCRCQPCKPQAWTRAIAQPCQLGGCGISKSASTLRS